MVFDSDNNLINVNFASGAISRNSQGQMSNIDYYITDHLGSIRAVIRNGAVVERNDYYPYGTRISDSSLPQLTSPDPQTLRYSGKEAHDAYGHPADYYGARFYTRSAQWLSQDPLAPNTPNNSPYTFCNNNPIKFIDPDGRKILISSSIGSADIIYNPDEKAYEDEEDPFVKAMIQSLNLLYEYGGKKLLDKLIASENIFKLVDKTPKKVRGYQYSANNYSRGVLFKGGGEIYMGLYNDKNETKLSIARGLSHELFHALQHEYGNKSSSKLSEFEAFIFGDTIMNTLIYEGVYGYSFEGNSSILVGKDNRIGGKYSANVNRLLSVFDYPSFTAASTMLSIASQSLSIYSKYPRFNPGQKCLISNYYPYYH